MSFEQQLFELNDIEEMEVMDRQELTSNIIKMARIMTKLLDAVAHRKELLLEDIADMNMEELGRLLSKMENIMLKLEEIKEM